VLLLAQLGGSALSIAAGGPGHGSILNPTRMQAYGHPPSAPPHK
jgi:hypothetical protein